MSEVASIIEVKPGAALAPVSPSQLLAMAVQNGASLDHLERLLALQERWEKSEAERAYNVAFSAFKAEAIRIVKNREVTDGPLRGKSYAELFSVVNAITPALSRHGLSAHWRITRDEPEWIEVTCVLKHERGHSESVSMGGPPDAGGAKNKVQARASTVTYLERYTLKAICGVSEGGDDIDGGGDGSGNVGFDPQPWIAKVRDAKTESDLTKVYGEAMAAAAAAQDREGAAQFKQAALAHRARLRDANTDDA